MSPAASLRLFFAAPLADELRATATHLQRELAGHTGKLRVKWVEAQNLHVTLKFVGDAPAARLAEFVAAAEAVARDTAPFSVQYRGVGCFARRGVPGPIWLGMSEGAGELGALAARLDGALVAVGLTEAERRPFAAHLTLGRVKDGRDGEELMAAIRRLDAKPIGEQMMQGFSLISSELTHSGPIHTERAVVKLGG